MEKITVLMAVYDPREDWFEQQLESINGQTYPDLELLICDDCSVRVSPERISQIVEKCVTRIPWRIIRNRSNMGSTRTFERLTGEADGDYFAYCDQDDIWHHEKLDKELRALHSGSALLVCTNSDAIDGNNQLIARHYMSLPAGFRSSVLDGTAWKKLMVRNYFWGCTMLVRADTARAALPFAPGMYHDHCVELYASMHGKILFLDETLLWYRRHGNNQTGFLKNIYSKADYCRERIEPLVSRYTYFLGQELKEEELLYIQMLYRWSKYRQEYAGGKPGAGIRMLGYSRFNFPATAFEFLLMPLPEPAWGYLLRRIRGFKGRKDGGI